jgi:hypothetical protein
MKARYTIFIIAILAAAIAFEYLLFASLLGEHPRLENGIQAAAVFIALLAAVVALAESDPKPRQVKVAIEPYIGIDHASTHTKASLPPHLARAFDHLHLSDPFSSHRVHFKMTNLSSFTLVRPSITFRLPLSRRNPHEVDGNYTATFNSNLFNSQDDLRILEFGDTQVLSNSNLPYWNDRDEVTIWVRMAFSEADLSPFDVEISVNGQNDQGITKRVQISPRTPRR